MKHHRVDRSPAFVLPLASRCSHVPYLHGAIFRTRIQPLGIFLKSYCSHISRVSFECGHWLRVVRIDIVQLDVRVSCSCQVPFIRCDFQAVHLLLGANIGRRSASRPPVRLHFVLAHAPTRCIGVYGSRFRWWLPKAGSCGRIQTSRAPQMGSA